MKILFYVLGIYVLIIVGAFVSPAFVSAQKEGVDPNLLIEKLDAFAGQAQIQVKIRENTPQGQYNDSLYYGLEEFANAKIEDIEQAKQTRVNNWIYIVTHPATEIQPTKAELEEQKSELQKQLDELQRQIDAKGK